jgi:hypothetical protein
MVEATSETNPAIAIDIITQFWVGETTNKRGLTTKIPIEMIVTIPLTTRDRERARL